MEADTDDSSEAVEPHKVSSPGDTNMAFLTPRRQLKLTSQCIWILVACTLFRAPNITSNLQDYKVLTQNAALHVFAREDIYLASATDVTTMLHSMIPGQFINHHRSHGDKHISITTFADQRRQQHLHEPAAGVSAAADAANLCESSGTCTTDVPTPSDLGDYRNSTTHLHITEYYKIVCHHCVGNQLSMMSFGRQYVVYIGAVEQRGDKVTQLTSWQDSLLQSIPNTKLVHNILQHYNAIGKYVSSSDRLYIFLDEPMNITNACRTHLVRPRRNRFHQAMTFLGRPPNILNP